MADGDKIDANLDGLHATSKKITQLGDGTDQSVGDLSLVTRLLPGAGRLAGFATDGPLNRIPASLTDAQHVLAGRFYVLGELVDTAAARYSTSDSAAARAIAASGALNNAPKGL